MGAQELGAPKCLREVSSSQPRVISGVTIGAIAAATLVGAKGEPIKALEGPWRKFAMPSSAVMPRTGQRILPPFGNFAVFRMRTDSIDGAAWLTGSIRTIRVELGWDD